MNKSESYFYKSGFSWGYNTAILVAKKYGADAGLILSLINNYNEIPLMDKIKIEDLENDK